MVDIRIKILDPADDIGFLTLDEVKTMFNITTTESDSQLQMMIDESSAVIARLCNRVFAKETCEEQFSCTGTRRVFLSHWPVREADMQSVVLVDGTVLDASAYELEEGSGKVSYMADGGPANCEAQWPQPVTITYAGGYDLPDEAPLPLKQACILLVREARIMVSQMATSGIRMIAHKESRVMFYDPNAAFKAGSVALGPSQRAAFDALLSHYIRYEC
jgi:hypothetical protein